VLESLAAQKLTSLNIQLPLSGTGAQHPSWRHHDGTHEPQCSRGPSSFTPGDGKSLPYEWRLHCVTASHSSLAPLGPLCGCL